jgi:hypothetical protein
VIGTIEPENDVRFLLVHHTASSNDYGPDEVTDQIRSFHSFHTGPDKGWPDVAYNFFIDRFGGVWEGRAGSIEGPVRGDATGGSQGFALLCSLIGNHAEAPVSAQATDSLVAVLAWLAERHSLDTTPGATVEFTSRGSNRWPSGATVTAATIAGHRDMSQTACPGDFAYDLLGTQLPTLVTTRRAEAATAAAQAETPTTPTTGTTESSAAANPDNTANPENAGTGGGTQSASGPDGGSSPDDGPSTTVLGAAATAAVAAVAGLISFRRRTERTDGTG